MPRRSMMYFLLVPLGVYLAVCLALFLLQERLIYYPDPTPVRPPAGFREVDLVASDGVRLGAWMLEASEPLGAVVICHGNAGNVASRTHLAATFRSMGLSVLLFDYRGYGNSEGSPTERGTYIDAEAAYDHLVEAGFGPERIALYGESLGGGVAIELARRRRAACLVVESTFTSTPDLGADVYWWAPVRLLARVQYDNAGKIGLLDLPLLLIHSRGDAIVPFSHARELLRRAPAGAELLETGGGHNGGGFRLREAWTQRVRDFLHAALGERS